MGMTAMRRWAAAATFASMPLAACALITLPELHDPPSAYRDAPQSPMDASSSCTAMPPATCTPLAALSDGSLFGVYYSSAHDLIFVASPERGVFALDSHGNQFLFPMAGAKRVEGEKSSLDNHIFVAAGDAGLQAIALVADAGAPPWGSQPTVIPIAQAPAGKEVTAAIVDLQGALGKGSHGYVYWSNAWASAPPKATPPDAEVTEIYRQRITEVDVSDASAELVFATPSVAPVHELMMQETGDAEVFWLSWSNIGAVSSQGTSIPMADPIVTSGPLGSPVVYAVYGSTDCLYLWLDAGVAISHPLQGGEKIEQIQFLESSLLVLTTFPETRNQRGAIYRYTAQGGGPIGPNTSFTVQTLVTFSGEAPARFDSTSDQTDRLYVSTTSGNVYLVTAP
jgi:hypothetical protein